MDYDKILSSRTLDQGNKLSDNEIQEIVIFYAAEIVARTTGPQMEGFEVSQLAEALRNDPENVLLLDIKNKKDEVIGRWPLFVPVVYHQDYSQRFFADHYPGRETYYLSLPPDELIASLVQEPERLGDIAQFLIKRRAIIAYDYQEGQESKELAPAFIKRTLADHGGIVQDVTPESNAWGKKYGLPLAVSYEGIARLSQTNENPAVTISEAMSRVGGQAERIGDIYQDGVVFFGAAELQADNSTILDQLWNMYSDQFDELVEDHPLLGKQPREEFDGMLLDEATINVVYIVDGKPVGLLYMVNDIEKCVWLNSTYYSDKFAAESGWMTHFPGIVVTREKAHQNAGYPQAMIRAVLEAVAQMNKDMIVTFACSNVSSTYIPRMVRRAIESSPFYSFDKDDNDLQLSQEYGYRILEVS